MSNYNYGPPPPPPSQAGHQGYGHHPNSYGQATPARGGGARGRGGGYMASYNAGRPEYQPPSQSPYPYSGYSPQQTPASYASDGSYQTPPQWQPEQAHAPPPPAHAPAPLSSSNYHPNYAQPGYGQPPYPSHPSYAPASQPSYPPQYAAAPPPASSPQWPTPPAHQPQGSGFQGGRHRGGYQGDRGGSRGASAIRVAYREEHPPLPATPAYGAAPYPDPRTPATPYQPQPTPQQYHYAPPPPPPPVAATPSTLPQRHDSHPSHGHGGNSRRGGRGGFRDGNNRGRSQFHGGGDRQRHHKKANNAQHESNHQKSDQPGQGKKKKRKVNTLGLIPGEASGSEEDDDGEEKKLSDLMGSEVIQITDMAAFIAERRKRYPTKERVEAKKNAELAQQAEKTEETSRLEREADELRRQLKKVESSIKRKREQQDEGDEMREASPEAESGADMPEVQSSRAPDDAAPLSAQAAKKADITRHCKYYSTGGSCGKKGKCRFVHDPAVREAAIREKEANNGQLTIKQRLILNDKEQDDLAVLESIQYLRDKGLMKTNSGIVSKPGAGPPGRPQGKTSKQATTRSTLPAPPPSLPLPPNKRENGVSKPPTPKAAPTPTPVTESPATPASTSASAAPASSGVYAGWNLSGYGGTGIQPEDLP